MHVLILSQQATSLKQRQNAVGFTSYKENSTILVCPLKHSRNAEGFTSNGMKISPHYLSGFDTVRMQRALHFQPVTSLRYLSDNFITHLIRWVFYGVLITTHKVGGIGGLQRQKS